MFICHIHKNFSSIICIYLVHFSTQARKSKKKYSGNGNPEKKIPCIYGNGNLKKASYISGNGTFQSTPRKFLILQEMEILKKFLIFSQKKAFLIFRQMETLKNSLYFRKRNFLIFQERHIQNSGITKLFYISGKVYSEH